MTGSSPSRHENCQSPQPPFSKGGLGDLDEFWVTVTKPVSYIVKGLRSRDFKDEQRNRMTIRASLPLPLDETYFPPKSLLTPCHSESGSTYQLSLMGCPFIYCFYVGKPDHAARNTARSTSYDDVDVFRRD